MYCATRVWITSHADQTTSSVMKLFSSDEQHRDAVHAQVVVDVEARDPLAALDELHARDAVVSKWSDSGSVTRKPASAPTSAIQRAARRASRSRPTASTARPATIGTQMDEREVRAIIRSRLAASTHNVSSANDADDHRERVVVDVAGLDLAHAARRSSRRPARCR